MLMANIISRSQNFDVIFVNPVLQREDTRQDESPTLLVEGYREFLVRRKYYRSKCHLLK
jgi:hypothetical protein